MSVRFCNQKAISKPVQYFTDDLTRKALQHNGSFPFHNGRKLFRLSSTDRHNNPYKRYLKMIISFIQRQNWRIQFIWSSVRVVEGVTMYWTLRAVASWLLGVLWWYVGCLAYSLKLSFNKFTRVVTEGCSIDKTWSS